MCGISFSVAKKEWGSPEWIPEASECTLCYNGVGNLREVQLSATYIDELISQDLIRDSMLSNDDKHKLANVDRLRELQEQLNIYKNAQHKPQNREMVEKIALEIASLNDGSVSDTCEDEQKGPHESLRAVLARGPDYAKYLNFSFKENHFQLLSSVLSLRQPFTKQPCVHEEWILQFNGELYNSECLESNDTTFIMDRLLNELSISKCRKQAVANVISGLEGEFAYVLLDLSENKVYFGKDSVGKRSLIFELTPENLTVSSVFPTHATNALECKGNELYVVDLSTYTVESFKLKEANIDPTCEENENTTLDNLYAYLQEACEKRQNTIYPLHPQSKDARIGILFSGGLDCTVLAAMIGQNFVNREITCRIDLLTVGFDNPRTGLSAASSPDRVLSEQSWYELSKLFYGSGVEFRLVQIDVSYEEWLSQRKRVRSLIFPCATEMDLSIAIAFYFATRAKDCELLEVTSDIKNLSCSEFGEVKEKFITRTGGYTSQAKVLFSGLGADELFGGYSRHENIFHGLREDSPKPEIDQRYEELSKSLVHDIDVIYERNLGRDDRAMSSWGKELRYPYLDRKFISWVTKEVKPELKVSFEWGVQKTKKGEKRVMKFERKYILRRLAERLGLELASKEIKRAIQFGAKSAKMEVGQQKARGTDAL